MFVCYDTDMTKQHMILTPAGIYAQEGDRASMHIGDAQYVVLIDAVTAKSITVVSAYQAPDGTYEEAVGSPKRTFRWNEKRQAYVHDRTIVLHLTH